MATDARTDDDRLLRACRDGDEATFAMLVRRHHGALVALARCWPGEAHEAERDVRVAWLALLSAPAPAPAGPAAGVAAPGSVRGRAGREVARAATRRTNVRVDAPEGPVVDPNRFFPSGHGQWPGEWADPPRRWGRMAARRLNQPDMPRLLVRRTRELGVARAAALTLRDIHEWPLAECAAALDLSEPQMRSLLRAAREGLRGALEAEIDSR